MLTRDTLAERMAAEVKAPKAAARDAINWVLGEIAGALAEGQEIQLSDFGKFSVTDRPARAGRNPRTGETIEIPAKRVAVFKPAKALKDQLNPPAPSVPRRSAGGR